MDEPLQHDPRTKQQIKDMLYAFLYTPVEQQLEKQLDQIITRNCVIQTLSHRSFAYKGGFYNLDTAKPPRRMNQLAPQLVGAMEDYLKELEQINRIELPYVMGFITAVLNASNDLHDYLRVLPEAVHHPIEQLITSCPCGTKKLTDFDVDSMQKKHQKPIDLIRQRMVTNLLI